ncbi:zinc finger protein AZF3-like [Salvia miltiorrhiza]|uniref:zinc finger protein AZF3-like n=1 Tax=Salvia miltiorrhiza TaxID=226208 RepID=UPI0025AC8948|nr:zinc finger protein AZF3-like [Salvia miltiorrhiza]
MEDDSNAPRWNMRAKRSKRPPPPLQHDDEIAAAEALILLANSGGGFCATAIDSASTTIPPKKHEEVSDSAVIAKKQEAASPDTPLPPPSYHCWLCSRVFQSSQALGGHMTSHRLKISDDKDRCNSAAASARIHECSCCHQTFATGQALGGHKRKHYDGPTLARKLPSTSVNRLAGDSGGESSDAAGATSHARPIIDLNLPPSPDHI